MQPEPELPQIVDESQPPVAVVRPPKRRLWLHLLLFAATCFTTVVVGGRLQQQFIAGEPMFFEDPDFFPLTYAISHPRMLLDGIPFSAALLSILFAHEMGHFLLALRYRVYATLPFFIPAPLPIGTFGAFIQIRSRFHTRAELLDIAVGGPVAGFAVALPMAVVGLLLSRPVPHPDVVMGLGHPLIFRLLHAPLVTSGAPPLELVLLHPIALAAWIGMLATALNLLPGGQLDGGHIVFALSPKAHRQFTFLGALLLLLAAWYLWSGWVVWAFAFLLTRRHPPVVYPHIMLPRSRLVLAWIGVLLLALTFMPVPLQSGSFNDAWQATRSHQR